MTDHRTTGSAGSGLPGPAEPSAASSGPTPARHPERSPAALDIVTPASSDVIAPEARRELDRIRRRWAELPVTKAADAAPLVRALVTDLAARTAADGTAPPADLGPAVLADQLTVLVWDAYALGRADGILERLTTLRQALP
ncbi:MAG: hypothetical protein ACRCY8_18790 [Dermatophilaceae bacterium]